MFIPKHFLEVDERKIRKLIEENTFATILSFPKNDKPCINHLPVIFSAKPGNEETLVGHMAKKNPQWQHFKMNPESTLIFHGGHTYITPSWYRSGRDVPTWNYAVAHLHGKMELVEDFDGQIEILKELFYFFENASQAPSEFELPEDLLDQSVLTSAIISFRFHIESIEAKYKLSQNRSTEDRQGVIEGLNERTDDMSKLVRRMMVENEELLFLKTN